jgi:Spy/CpxP family protein refolding chaperone
MTKSVKKILIGAAALWLGMWLAPLAAHSEEQAPGKGMGPGRGMHRMGPMEAYRPEVLEELADKIGADEKTVVKIKDLAYTANKDLIDLRAEMERAHLEMRKFMDSDAPDEGAIMKHIEKAGAVEIKLRKNRIGLILAVRKLLTPEQRTKLKGMIEERMEHERGQGQDMPKGPMMKGPQGGPGQ